ncbi:MAG: sulfite exporter TauE/SafE family protein [Saprospiraceae bacterium]|nr:sulfite exporter TauE/SafE family protein [Saprospiraceae bacterium]
MAFYLAAIATGLVIGFLGSFHCIAMCGPLAMAMPLQENKNWSILFYNTGRVFSYTLLGLFFGMIGMGFTFYKIQQFFSLFTGVLLIMYAFNLLTANPFKSFYESYMKVLRNRFEKLNKQLGSIGFAFGFGVVNGFLPCGLVYLALVTAVSFGDISQSVLIMLGFGVGTIPLMFIFLMLRQRFSHQFSKYFFKLQTLFHCIVWDLIDPKRIESWDSLYQPIHQCI